MSLNTGYLADGGGLITLTLPAGASLGNMIRVAGLGSGGWSIATGGQTIVCGVTSSSTGVSSTNQYDCIELVYVSGSKLVALSTIGNPNFA
jgi:hypothetical protein